jgi:hypothetical protein
MDLMKSLLFYPLRVLGGLFVFTGKILGGFFVFGFLLIAVFKLAGELDVAWWIVAACGVVGTLSLALAELYVQLLLKLRSTGQDQLVSQCGQRKN